MEVNALSVSTTESLSSLTRVQTAQGGEVQTVTQAREEKSELNISAQGQSLNQLDKLYEQVDNIYESKLSAEELKEIDNIYSQLDQIFAAGNPGAAQQAEADRLFETLDTTFAKVENALTADEKKKIGELESQIESIEGSMPEDEIEGFFAEVEEQFEEIEALDEQQEDILLATLNAQDKKQVDDIHKQLESLFDSADLNEDQEKVVDKLFDTLDSIMNKAYNQLSDADKEQVAEINEQIEEIEGDMLSNLDEQMNAYQQLQG